MQKNKPYKYLEDKGNNNINIKKILIKYLYIKIINN